MRLGEHPVIEPILARVLEDEIAFLRNLALSRGVAEEDIGDVINEAYLDIHKIEPQGEIEAQLRILEDLPQPEESEGKLRDSLTALFVYYLKLKCLDYHRKRKRRQNRFSSLEHEIERGTLPSLISEDRSLRDFLLDAGLSSRPDVNQLIQGLEQGNRFAILRFCALLAEKTGLDERERDFLVFRVERPEARDQDFNSFLRTRHPNLNLVLKPYEISRIKSSTLRKLIGFFGLA